MSIENGAIVKGGIFNVHGGAVFEVGSTNDQGGFIADSIFFNIKGGAIIKRGIIVKCREAPSCEEP